MSQLSTHHLPMHKSFIPVLTALSLFLTACGGDKNSDEHFIELPEDKKPADVSGDVEVIERKFTINLQAPTPAYSVKIESVYVVGQEIFVICKLSEKEGMATQVITEISDSVTLKLPDISPQFYVIGKKIGPATPGVTFINSIADIQAKLDVGMQEWPKQ